MKEIRGLKEKPTKDKSKQLRPKEEKSEKLKLSVDLELKKPSEGVELSPEKAKLLKPNQGKAKELKPKEEAKGTQELKQKKEKELQPAKELKPGYTQEFGFKTEEIEEEEDLEEEEEDVLLTKEEIAERLKQAHQGSGIPIPAIKAGHRRIKQNPKGPHILLKPKLVEQRDEKRQAERMGETVESASQEIVKQEHEMELAVKAETMKRAALHTADPHSKAIPSVYYPPEKPIHYNTSNGSEAHLNPFQPASRGKQFLGQ